MKREAENRNHLIHQILTEQLRIGMGLDFHSFYAGYPLTLAGVVIPFDRGFHVKRSDGDPVAHALVDALLAASGEGDIADWFNDQDGVTNARSLDYLGELYEKLLLPRNITILNIQAILLAEQPKLKHSIQGKTFEGKGMIGQQQGIEVQAIVALLQTQQEI